jgi:hypothetical protein
MANISTVIILLIITLAKADGDETFEVPELNDIFSTAIIKVLKDTLQSIDFDISEQCQDALALALYDKNHLYTTKFLKDSSKNINDVGTYMDCYKINYKTKSNKYTYTIANNLTYIVFNVENRDMNSLEDLADIRYEAGNFMFGTCFIAHCNTTDFRNIFFNINQRLNIFTELKYDDIEVFDIKEGMIEIDFITMVKLSPVLFILVFFVFSKHPPLPAYLFKCCFRKRDKKVKVEKRDAIECSDNINLSKKTKFLKKYFKKFKGFNETITDKCRLTCFKNCFDAAENSHSLTNDDIKDKGLNVINGLRAIAILFTIAGVVLRVLYLSPVKIFCKIAFKEMVSHYSFSLLVFGRRVGPSLLFSISGYILIYKLITYLDDKVEDLELEDKYKRECKLIFKYSKFCERDR